MTNAATFTIGAETANARNVLVQLGSRTTRGSRPRNAAAKRVLQMYLSSDAAGDTVVNPVAVGVAPTVGAAGKLIEGPVAAEQPTFQIKTDATGKANVVLTNAADANVTVYLNVIDGATGKVYTSAPIAFIDD